MTSRVRLFAALCVVCVLVAGGYAVAATHRARAAQPGHAAPAAQAASANPANPANPSNPANPAVAPAAVKLPLASAPGAAPYVLFRSTALNSQYGQLALERTGDSSSGTAQATRQVAALGCDRVYAAAGQGLCLRADRGVFTTYQAIIFDADFQPRHTLPLSGLPSRARMSPDGRYAAMTVFVSGDSYASTSLSTRTTVVDTASGALLGDLEQFAVERDGARFEPADRNFWGVTFAADSNRFYATMSTGDKLYLVEGDLAARRVRVLRDGVECPSLSPDNTRIAFKKRLGGSGPVRWQPAVLDLATMRETPLTLETRSIDDQIEWLDDGHILYGMPDQSATPTAATSVWVMPADGSAAPRVLLANAWSPSVVR